MQVRKRNGNLVDFEIEKIVVAIEKAMNETEEGIDEKVSQEIAHNIAEKFKDDDELHIEKIQDNVEIELMKVRPDVAKKYIIYRQEREKLRKEGWDMTDLQRLCFS